MYNNNNQNPDHDMPRLPETPQSYIVFVDGNMAGKELKCSCGKIYAWLDKKNLMTGECRNDPVISAFLKNNYNYDTRNDSYDAYISRSSQNYHSPPRVSDRDYYRYNNERSRRSPSPYHHSQSRHSNHRERRHSRSYSGSRSRSRSPSARRRSRHYRDDSYSQSRDNMYNSNRNYLDGSGISTQPPLIQYQDIKPQIQQQSQQPLPPIIPLQPPQLQQQRQPIMQVPSIQQQCPSNDLNRQPSPPIQQQQPLPPMLQQQQTSITSTATPLLNNNNNNNKQESSWSSSNSRDKAWASYDIEPTNTSEQQQQHPYSNNNNINNNTSSSPQSDSDNSSINSNYEQQQQQQSEPEEEKWEIPLPINELYKKYPGKTMDDVGREQLIKDIQAYNRDQGLDSEYDSVAQHVDYQINKNRILLRLEYIVKTVDKCPLSRISSLYEEKYGEKLEIQKYLGFKKLSKCLESYGFKQQPLVNLTIVTPSNKIWF